FCARPPGYYFDF
nr:immunoglobulin heavy chain junction region [Mus musculus]